MTVKYKVSGLDCPNCAKKLAALVGKINGVSDVKLNFLSEDLTLEAENPGDALDAEVKRVCEGFEDGISVRRK